MGTYLFKGIHAYLGSSYHFYDLRGRNLLLNAARWLVALASGDRDAKVHVHVESRNQVDKDLLRDLSYLIYPSRIYEELHGSNELIAPETPWNCFANAVCTLCGRPVNEGTIDLYMSKVVSEVSKGEMLDTPCLVARLFGRAANKPAFVFVVGMGAQPPLLKCADSISIRLRAVEVEFCEKPDEGLTVATLRGLCEFYVSVVGVSKKKFDERVFEEYADAVRDLLRRGQAERRAEAYLAVADSREEFFGELLKGADIGGLPPVYQPSDLEDVGYVPQLSGVNAGGQLAEIHTENLAVLGGSNVVYLVRVDGDKFGRFVRQSKISERIISVFKSAISAVVETAPGMYSVLIYAGGDENLVVASAADARRVLHMLEDLRGLFTSFGEKHGQELTISAGIVASRYKMPMYHMVMLADKAVEEAKLAGGDAVALLYAKGLTAEDFGVVKFPHLREALVAASKYAEERPDLSKCTQMLYAQLFRGSPPPKLGLEKTLAFVTNLASLI